MHQTAREQLTGQTQTSWIHILPDIIEIINEGSTERVEKREKQQERKVKRDVKKGLDPDRVKDIACTSETCDLLNVGTVVRTKLDNPEDYVTGKRQHGGFRAGDTKGLVT